MLKTIITIITLVACGVGFGQQISGGTQHSLFLCSDGTVKASGRNDMGQLGLGHHQRMLLPESVSISGITAVSAFDHSLFLKDDKTVWACGRNDIGQLGLGNTNNTNTPTQILNLTGITAISAGSSHSLFLKEDGTVWACGRNNFGQLGLGNTTSTSTPIQIPGLNDVVAIAAGVSYSLFLKDDGTVLACGNNMQSQLGLSNTGILANTTPTQIPNLNGITAISAGASHSLFLGNDGTVWATGFNLRGQLGLGNFNWSKSPTKISTIENITAISVGQDHSLFLKNDGTVLSCGRNMDGQLGHDAVLATQNTPIIIPNLTDIIAISAGASHSLFLKNDGTFLACGYNGDSQFGLGNTTPQIFSPTMVPTVCTPPEPPTVDFSHFPSSVCLGSNLNVNPSITGSNPSTTTITVDNSIIVTAPKAITKNKNSIFVLNDADGIVRYDLDGTLNSSYPNLNITTIQSFAADDSSNVYLFNGDGKIYKCDSTGTLINTQTILWETLNANQLVLTKPVDPASWPQNLFLIDEDQSFASITGVNTYDNDLFSNSNIFPASGSGTDPFATSMSVDNFYENKRALLADPTNSTLHSRILYPPANNDYEEAFLVDSVSTVGMAFDFIDADTLFKIFSVSSSTTGILGIGSSFLNVDGNVISFVDTSMTSTINPVEPIGSIITKAGSANQFWVADRGQNRILRAFPSSYQITPNLPDGLTYDNITGEIKGTPTVESATQTYQVIFTTPFGADTTLFTFEVTNTSGLTNSIGTGSSTGQQDDGLTIKYFNANNCEKLFDIEDLIGGTSPGYTEVSQTVYPVVSIISNENLIRRVTEINAENSDNLNVNITFYYTFEDIQLYKQSTGSTLSNDTLAGTMDIAILQMHEKSEGGKEPIVHSPVTAQWITAEKNWKAVVPVTKFSEFYAGDPITLQDFDCTSDSTYILDISNTYYVWNNDTLFTSGVYIDTLFNQTGCDSIVSLDITLQPLNVNEFNIDSGVHIYPNPSNGLFNIKLKSNDIHVKSIKATDLLGSIVYSSNLSGNSTIDLSNQSNGIYFIIIETEDNSPLVFRVIKE